MKTKITRNLPNDAYEAATNANNPSASNPFITEVESAVSSASLILYPTSAASVIPTYNKLVNTVSDPDYDDPAVDSSTGVINATGQLIAEFASEEGVIDGNPGVVNVNTIGNIRRVSGTGTASFYFEVYHRDNLGTETLIGTSNTTGASSNPVYEQYFASCLINATNFGPTDRVVTKWYANRLSGGSDPIYEIQLGGATPVKITFPVPFVNLPSTVEELNDLTDVTTGLPGSPTNADDGRVLYYDVDSGQWISDDIANISNVVKDCKTSVLTGSIPKGTPVYLAGYDNDLLVVEPCDAASSATMPCIGITAEALDDTNAKKVVSFGKIQGVDTSLWADGTELYVATGGGFSTTRPTGTAEIQRIAIVLKGLDATGGSIKVFNTSRTSGLPNLQQGNIWLGDADGYPQEEPLCPFLASDLQPTDIIAICRWNGSSYDRFAINADDFTQNLYNADGTLTGFRTVDINGLGLVINDSSAADGPRIQATQAATKMEWKLSNVAGDINSFYAGPTFIQMRVANASIPLYLNADAIHLVNLTSGISAIQDTSLLSVNRNYQWPDQSGTIALLSDITGGGAEKHIDTFYAYDMSPAAAGGGTYSWNTTSVGASALVTLSESYRLQLFSGTGQADGCFVNSIMPNYYTANADIQVTLVFSTNGTGGDVRFHVGLQQPNGANFGTDVDTIWQNYTFTAAAGFPVAKATLTFSPTNIGAAFPIAVKVYRDPGDAADTYTGDAYLNTIGIEIS